MKKKDVFSLYAAIKDLKLSTMGTTGAMAIINVCRVARPAVEEYQTVENDFREKCKPDGFDDLIEKENKKQLSESEKQVMLKKKHTYYQSLNKFYKEEMEANIDLSTGKLTEEDIDALRKENPNLNADALSVIVEMMM